MGMLKHNDEWRLPDEMCNQIKPLLPPRKPHPLDCHRPRVSDRKAMDAILFVLGTVAFSNGARCGWPGIWA